MQPHSDGNPQLSGSSTQQAEATGLPSLGEELLADLAAHLPRSTLTHVRDIPARPSQPADWPSWAHPDVVEYLVDRGVTHPWIHQVATAEAAWEGRDVIVATGTASGKSLGYQLPILSALAHAQDAQAAPGRGARPSEPLPTALYLCPTKALAQDQVAQLARMCRDIPALAGVSVATYDGDTPPEQRRIIRDEAHIIVTNPDMVHASILGNAQRWGRLLRTLRYVVVDEAHVYRGVFGAHTALVMRRLLRLARSAGGPGPTIVLASATSADPSGHARRLVGRSDVLAVTQDGSPSGAQTVALWEPAFLPEVEGANGAPVRRAATTEAADIMGRVVANGARTLTFVRSRRNAETVALATVEKLQAMGRPDDAARIAAYRAGYTPEARRQLERRLDDGELLGVATTNALELGIDVGGLDAVVIAGFPGTVASFRQQAGRAGRRGQGSLVVLVASDNPLDTYLVNHPSDLLDRTVESSVFDPSNPYILAEHLVCAALERPLSWEEVEAWGAAGTVEDLLREGVLRRRPRGLYPDLRRATGAHSRVAIRGGAADQVAIVDAESGRLLGTLDAGRAVSDVHTGAVYLHQGESFVVELLNLEESVAWVRAGAPEYTTAVQKSTAIRVLGTRRTRRLAEGMWLADVDVEVSHQVEGYVKRLPTGEVLEVVPLDAPPQRLVTRAVAYTVDPDVLLDAGLPEPVWPGTLHAAEHAAIGLLPLIATCDRWDIGGVSTVEHVETGLPTVFVYDGYTGGAGFAERGFDQFGAWMEATAAAVGSCGCAAGCPSCVQSPKCGNGNDPLFKAGALELLTLLADAARE